MFSKNTLYILKKYQILINKNITQYKWNPLSSALFKKLNKNVFATDMKYMHSAATLLSEKVNEKPQYKVKKVITEDGIVKVQKKINIPRITLFTSENGMEIITMEDAQKIASRRNLKLIQVSDIDPKTGRPIYKLSSVSGENEKNKKDRSKNNKDEKILSINSNINEHDLQSKLKSILKWLEKGHTVKASISGDMENLVPAETIFKTISEGIVNVGRIVQKNTKNGEIKFHIVLPKKTTKKESPTNSKDSLETPTE